MMSWIRARAEMPEILSGIFLFWKEKRNGFLSGKIKTLYFKYLLAAFGSALITSIYSIVDMAMVGQYHGPAGTAALAVVAPIWNIIYSLELLMGIGGSVIFSMIRGQSKDKEDSSNEYFTVSILGAIVFSLIAWFVIIFFDKELLMLFGADESTLTLAREYVYPIKFVIPCFLFTQAMDAGLATAIGTGFSTFFIDIAMGILTILFNRQIMTYLGTNALSIYGVIVNVSTFVQCCAYSVGQASQPIFSTNYGAGKWDRVKETLKYALYTAGFFAILWTVLCLTIPNQFIHIFMTPTKEVLEIAPSIISTYGLSFLLLPINIFSTYYFQAIMKPNVAFIVSVARGLIISGLSTSYQLYLVQMHYGSQCL